MTTEVFILFLAILAEGASAFFIIVGKSARTRRIMMLTGLSSFIYARNAMIKLMASAIQIQGSQESIGASLQQADNLAFIFTAILLLSPLLRLCIAQKAKTLHQNGESTLRFLAGILVAVLCTDDGWGVDFMPTILEMGSVAFVLFAPIPFKIGIGGPPAYRKWNRMSQVVPAVLIMIIFAIGGVGTDFNFNFRSPSVQAVASPSTIKATENAVVRELDPQRIQELRPIAQRAFHFGEQPIWTEVPELFNGQVPLEIEVSPTVSQMPAELHVINIESEDQAAQFSAQSLPLTAQHPALIHVKRSSSPVSLLIFGASQTLPLIDVEVGAKLEAIYLFVNQSEPREIDAANISIEKYAPDANTRNIENQNPNSRHEIAERTRKGIFKKEFTSVRKDGLLRGAREIPTYILRGYLSHSISNNRGLEIADENLKALVNSPSEIFSGMHWTSRTTVANGQSLSVPSYLDLATIQDMLKMQTLLYSEHEVKALSGFTRLDGSYSVTIVGNLDQKITSVKVPDQYHSTTFVPENGNKYFMNSAYNSQTKEWSPEFFSMKSDSFEKNKIDWPSDVAGLVDKGLRVFGYNNLSHQLVFKLGNSLIYTYNIEDKKWSPLGIEAPGLLLLVPSPSTNQLFGLTSTQIVELDQDLKIVAEKSIQALDVHTRSFNFTTASVLSGIGKKIVAEGVQNGPDLETNGNSSFRYRGYSGASKTFFLDVATGLIEVIPEKLVHHLPFEIDNSTNRLPSGN